MQLISFNYDKDRDVAILSLGDDKFSDIKELEKNIFIKRDIFNNQITAILFFNYSKTMETSSKTSTEKNVLNYKINWFDIIDGFKSGKKMSLMKSSDFLIPKNKEKKDFFNNKYDLKNNEYDVWNIINRLNNYDDDQGEDK